MTLTEKWQDLKHDITTSWFFRIWSLLFLICLCVSFGAMSIYASRARNASNEQGLRRFITYQDSIAWPQFRIRSDFQDQNPIDSIDCNYGAHTFSGSVGAGIACSPSQSTTYCQLFQPTRLATRPHFRAGDFIDPISIHCKVITAPTTGFASTDMLVGYEIADPDGFNGGDNAFASMWMWPSNGAWILITKEILRHNGQDKNDWHRSLEYRTSMHTQPNASTGQPGYLYNVTISFDTMAVKVYQEGDWFSGWMSAGALGGFVCLLYVVLNSTMLIINLFVKNDSRLLSGTSDTATDSSHPAPSLSTGSASYGGL